MARPSSSALFRSLRTNLRAVLFCALLLAAHVLLSTLGSLQTHFVEYDDPNPAPLSPSAIPRVSGLIFITLLCHTFTLFEQVDSAETRGSGSGPRSAHAASQAEAKAENSTSPAPSAVSEKGAASVDCERERERILLFSTTATEGVVGLITLGLWIAILPTLGAICNTYSSGLAHDLIILPAAFGTIVVCVFVLNLQLAVELARRAAHSDLRGRWWVAPVGMWVGRVELDESA